MKAYEVVGIMNNGEVVCPACMTPEENSVATDEGQVDEITPIFAGECEEDETCSRCGEKLL